jgi:hypothetical protein
LGKRRRRKTWKVIGHWSDPPPPEAPAPPDRKAKTEADGRDLTAVGMLALLTVPRFLGFLATPVLAPLIAGINPDYLAGGFALGIAMTGIGALLLGFVRRHNRAALRSDAAAITLMGHRLPRAVMASGLLTTAPCVLLWIDIGYYSYLIWTAFALLAMVGALAFLSVIRQQGVIAIDAFGVRFRDLWSNTLPWSNVKDIRIETEAAVDWLVFDLLRPLPTAFRPGSLFAVRTRLSEDRNSLFIHWQAYQADVDDLLAFLKRHLDDHRQWATARETAPDAVTGPDESARALRDMDPAMVDE